MPDETNGNSGGTPSVPSGGTGDKAAANANTNAFQGWTEQDFRDALKREADKEVSRAHVKWADDMKSVLGTADLNEFKTHLDALASQAKQTEARANFAEAAITQGIADVKAAWAVAKEYGLINEKGKTDFDELKTNHPSLFGMQRNGTTAGRPADVDPKNQPKTLGDALKQFVQEKK